MNFVFLFKQNHISILNTAQKVSEAKIYCVLLPVECVFLPAELVNSSKKFNVFFHMLSLNVTSAWR